MPFSKWSVMTLKSYATVLFTLIALFAFSPLARAADATAPSAPSAPSVPSTPSTPSAAGGGQTIAAVVNDEVISVRDLQNRIDLVVATSNIGNTPEARQKITPEVLRMLIDERLKRQEATRLNITVTPQDMEQGLGDIAQQLNIPASKIPEYLQARGAAMPALLSQLESEIAWIKAIGKLASDRSSISEEEVAEEIKRLELTAGGNEYHMAEIFLPIEDDAGEAQAMDLANRIVNESRSGASFAQLARSFSQSSSAEEGGDLGWVRQGQLGPRLDAVMQNLRNGEISPPIRTETGVYILQLTERRTAPGIGLGPTAVRLSQMTLPLAVPATQAQVDEQLLKARDLRGTVSDCAAFTARGKEIGASVSGDLGRIDLDKLPPQIRQIIAPLSVGQVSEPIRTADGVVVLMLCERENMQVSQELRASVQRRLFEQRMSAISRQTMRDLRRTALLDIRS